MKSSRAEELRRSRRLRLARTALLFVSLALVKALPAYAADECTPVIARVVSVEGKVFLVRAADRQTNPNRPKDEWPAAAINVSICPGDWIYVAKRSRAALRLFNETTVRLDQNTTVAIDAPDKQQVPLLDLFSGALHAMTRTRRPFLFRAGFMNGNINGTEFLVRVDEASATLAVYEGQVTASGAQGAVTLNSGEVATVTADQPPRKDLIVRPRDAVQWALYYPAVIDYRLTANIQGTPGEGAMRESVDLYRQGKLDDAIARLERDPGSQSDARLLTSRAGLLLAVGRLDEARPALERALGIDPNNSDAHALLAVIAVVQDEKERALTLAKRAVELDKSSPPARLALSYVYQAQFKINAALSTIQEAVELNPQNALAFARLAELYLSIGRLDEALSAATSAVDLDPRLARTQSVLGFANLIRVDTGSARAAFEVAIRLDPSDPLSRLGLGLAKIRKGELQAGREEIEIAANLDPGNSLVRSYLGKAYYEERRDELAATQFQLARARDGQDPTPWFYDAIRKQSEGRPVDAAKDLEESIRRNENRAVYRSRLLLDEDAAARNASLARVYRDMGFDHLALRLAQESVAQSPQESQGHRFLADAYLSQPRHEIARVSELLQAQLRQPLTLTPLQPQLGEGQFVALRDSGPAAPGLNEFNSAFTRNQLALDVSGILGNHHTFGDQAVFSGIYDRWAFSIAQLLYATEGFRVNNDFRDEVHNGFVQLQVSPNTSFQMELRSIDQRRGDPVLRFEPELFFTDRDRIRSDSTRFGFRQKTSLRSDLIVSLQAVDSREDVDIGGTPAVKETFRTYVAEAQYALVARTYTIISGAGLFRERDEMDSSGFLSSASPRASGGYGYLTLKPLERLLLLEIGVSAEHQNTGDVSNKTRNQINPKLGVTLNLPTETTFRMATFRVLKRPFFANQTVEPTQVAGFNQFYDDFRGTDSRKTAVAVDQILPDRIYVGIEAWKRNLTVPFDFTSEHFAWKERYADVHFYWAPSSWATVKVAQTYEKLERTPLFPGFELFVSATTRRLPVSLQLWPAGSLSGGVTVTHVKQQGAFYSFSSPDPVPGSDTFDVTDFNLSYRFPSRRGYLRLEIRNAFKASFQFQETDFRTTSFARDRFLFGRLLINF